MPKPTSPSIYIILFVISAVVRPGRADDDAASNYLFAILELGRQLPDYVDSATTDHPNNGFTTQLSDVQVSFLRQRSVVSTVARFDHATSRRDCVWKRYTSSSWSDAGLNDHLHRLARIVLLRARANYESAKWIDGNRDVERVRIMARHMSLQARPFEHQCFMVENMATGTAAAYLPRFPDKALADLSERHGRLGVFSPMSRMMTAEAERIRVIADDYEGSRVTLQRLLSCVGPYLATDEDVRIFGGSRQETARQLRGLSAFIDDLSSLMDRDRHEVEERIAQFYNRYAQSNRLIAGLDGWPVEEYRENAQGVCRGIMFGAVIDRMREGRDDFSNIDDPYGHGSLGLRTANTGFTLVSELMHHSRIDFRFGLAGPAGQRTIQSTPSGEVGRNELDDLSSPPGDR